VREAGKEELKNKSRNKNYEKEDKREESEFIGSVYPRFSCPD
jgi:hypothetical protein